MSEWHCDTCKTNYREKPTYTTSCKICGTGLGMGLNPKYAFSDEGKLNNRFCAFCGERIEKGTEYFYLLKAQIYDSEPIIKKSKRIHGDCHYKIESGNYEELPENKKYFKKEYAIKEESNDTKKKNRKSKPTS